MRIIFFLLICFLIFAQPVSARDYEKLPKSLSYIFDIPEVSWVDFDQNNVYIGWLKIPADFSMINRAAAVIGNREIGFGVHVWSVKAKDKGWRPGDGPYYCETTARKGKVQDSSCK